VHTVHVGVPDRFGVQGGFTGREPPEAVPEGFDYSMWLGQCPSRPYTPARCHHNFRWITDYSAGYITDFGAHYLDVVHWALGADDSGPQRVSATGEFAGDGIYDAPLQYTIEYSYGETMVLMRTVPASNQWGMRFEGTDGSIYVENSTIVAQPRELAAQKIGPGEVHLYESVDHHRDFIDRVISPGQTAAPVEVGHRSATACHLGYIALRVGRKIAWDPHREQIIGDTAAAQLLSRPMRSPWLLTG